MQARQASVSLGGAASIKGAGAEPPGVPTPSSSAVAPDSASSPTGACGTLKIAAIPARTVGRSWSASRSHIMSIIAANATLMVK
jgi:hypothetical protein